MKTFREWLGKKELEVNESMSTAETTVRNMSPEKIEKIINSNIGSNPGAEVYGVDKDNIVKGAVLLSVDNKSLSYISNGSITVLNIKEKTETTIYINTKILKQIL